MKIIARYITKEMLTSFLTITGILVLIVLSNRFALYLAKAASGELSLTLVFQIVGLYIPELLAYLIPLGFFTALLLVFGRLYSDSEMTVLFACGMSKASLVRQTLTVALVVMLMTALLTLWVVPKVAWLRKQVLSKGEISGAVQSLLPQRFQTFSDGRLVFYLEDIASKTNVMQGVFIAEQPTYERIDQRWVLITAEQARVDQAKEGDDLYLVLQDGYRYQGIPGQADYTTVSFQEYGRALPMDVKSQNAEPLRAQETEVLWRGETPPDLGELQWRLSLPLSVPILALIALPLSRVDPRRGRFSKLLPAFVIYIFYYNLFTVSKRWVAASVIPPTLGVWWVHGVFFLLGVVLLMRDQKK